MKALNSICLILMVALAVCGCASKAKKQAQMRRAYAAGEMSARAQMQQQAQQTPPPMDASGDPQVRILGAVKNPVLDWSNDLTLGRAVVEAEYQKSTTPTSIIIYRNNQPLHVDPQRMLNGEDYPLFPGDIVYIEN